MYFSSKGLSNRKKKSSSHIAQLQNGGAGKAPRLAVEGFFFTNINSTHQKQNRGHRETDERMEGLHGWPAGRMTHPGGRSYVWKWNPPLSN